MPIVTIFEEDFKLVEETYPPIEGRIHQEEKIIKNKMKKKEKNELKEQTELCNMIKKQNPILLDIEFLN